MPNQFIGNHSLYFYALLEATVPAPWLLGFLVLANTNPSLF